MNRALFLTIVIFYSQFACSNINRSYFKAYTIFNKIFTPFNCVLIGWYSMWWYKAHNNIKLSEKDKEKLVPSNTSDFTVQYTDIVAKRVMNTLHAQNAKASIIGILLATIGPLLMQIATKFLQ